MKTNTLLFCAYLRDSGGEDQDLSVEQQHQAIKDYCHKQGYILSRVFQDLAAPGSSVAGRDAFREMMAYFRTGQARKEHKCVRGCTIQKHEFYFASTDFNMKFCAGCLAMVLYYWAAYNLQP